MPLVVPQSESGNRTDEWQNKLVGKTLHDDESNETAFSKRELPEEHRVIGPNTRTTRDFRENRLNVHVSEEGIVTHCTYG